MWHDPDSNTHHAGDEHSQAQDKQRSIDTPRFAAAHSDVPARLIELLNHVQLDFSDTLVFVWHDLLLLVRELGPGQSFAG
jgi:hypothetical protein